MTRISPAPLLPDVSERIASPGTCPTVATAIRLVSTWTDLSASRRQSLLAALKLIPKILGQPADMIALDPAVLGPALSRASPGGLGISGTSLSTYRNSIRAVMRRVGLIESPRRNRVPMTPAWASLRAALTDKYLSAALQDFMAYCSDQRLAPDAVDDTTLDAYYRLRRDRRLKGDPLQIARRVARTWRRAAGAVPGWPQQALTPPASTFRYSLRFTAYPATFQADAEAFRRRMQPDCTAGLYSGPLTMARPLSPASVKTRLTAIRLAAAALVGSDVPIQEITDLASLVRPENAKKILSWHYERAGRKTNDHTGAIAETLRIIGKYHLRLDGPELAELVAITRRAKPPKRKEITAKNATRLAQFDGGHAMASILHLPRTLLDVAQEARGKGRHLEAGWIAQIAVAIEIELVCPLRVADLVHLRLGTDLVKLDPKGRGFTHLLVHRTSKTKSPAQAKLHRETIGLLQTYLEVFRPALPNAGSEWLFPSRGSASKPRAATGLSTAISRVIYEHTGLRMNTHLFRAFAGAIALVDNPGGLEDLRLILGHTTLQTTMTYYAAFNRKAASERHMSRISTLRDETRLAAKAPRANPGKRR